MMALRACRAVGRALGGCRSDGDRRGLVCIEVNSGGEFHGLMTTTDVDIADEIVHEALAAATHLTGVRCW